MLRLIYEILNFIVHKPILCAIKVKTKQAIKPTKKQIAYISISIPKILKSGSGIIFMSLHIY